MATKAMQSQSVSALPTVAIAGSTGHLGHHIVEAFLSPDFHSHFSKLILLSRQKPADSALLTKWAEDKSVVVHIYDENDLRSSLEGVDILINAIGSSGSALRDRLVQSLPKSKVWLYIPSEFGVDHTLHDFSHPEWDKKKIHFDLVQEVAPEVQVCRIFCGFFLEDSIGPWFGFNTKDNKYECIGSRNTRATYTSLFDVGKVVASLCSLPRDKIPQNIHICGDVRSASEVAEKMTAAGAGDIEITEVDLTTYKRATIAERSTDAAKCLRFLMGQGSIDHSPQGLGNDNELVNAKEGLWRWKTIEDLARETGGKPWST